MQIDEKYSIKELDWDTNFFGIKSAKIVLKNDINVNDTKKIKEYVKNNKFDFVTIQNNDNNDNNNFIMKEFENIFLADLNVQFIKKINKDISIEEYDKEISINNNLEYDEDIITISETSFIYSRFINDKNLKNGNKVYSEWTKNSFENSDKFFITYREKNKVIGFLLFSINNEEIIIELIAVNSKYKKKGIGKKLLRNLDIYAINNNKKAIKVGTQVNNIGAQNFYQSCGFKHIKNNSIYHLWLNN